MNEYNEIPSRTEAKRKPARRRYKRNKKLIVLAVAVLILVIASILAVIFVFRGRQNTALLGTWQYDEYTQYEFLENGQGCLCVDDVHYEYEYAISSDTVKIDFTEDIVRDCEYTFKVNGNALTFIGGKGTDGGTYLLNKEKGN